MHIPDGYLSPQTFVPMYALMAPIWLTAARKVRLALRTRHVPLLALGAAFSFVLMMFNIPVPGGTSGHAVGGALVAILLGPWAACLAVSLALVIQALMFGDGGITALGANSFTMAVVMPFVGYYSYRLIAGNSPVASARRMAAGMIAGYLALNAAALYSGILLGLQPLIASAPDGRPLYAPYSLAVAVPAMAFQHLLFLGVIEGIATAFTLRYLQRTDPALLSLGRDGEASAGTMQKLRSALAIMALLSPLGVILPWAFGAKSGWGEWSTDELARLAGFVPAGMRRLGELWHAPFSDYSFAGIGHGGTVPACLAYLLSAALGVTAIGVCARICGKVFLVREEK